MTADSNPNDRVKVVFPAPPVGPPKVPAPEPPTRTWQTHSTPEREILVALARIEALLRQLVSQSPKAAE